MITPFESAAVKLHRAEEIGQQLTTEIEQFLRECPAAYHVTGNLRNANREYVFTLSGELSVPIRFSVLFGEVMYQLRTALDHLLAGLVMANGSTPTDRHQFPICSTAQKFAEAEKRGDFRGVSPQAASFIEQIQPYQPTQPKPSS